MTSDTTAALRTYTLANQRIAECIRAAQQALQANNRQEDADRCQALLVDLAEDHFNTR